MAYFIFLKNLDNVDGTIYRMAEDQSYLSKFNINTEDYKIIEDSNNNFNNVKYGITFPQKYNNNIITYVDVSHSFENKENLNIYVSNFKTNIKQFLNNHSNNLLCGIWNDYYNQLNSLNLDSIIYPLNKSLEQYFKDQNQPSLSPLQLP